MEVASASPLIGTKIPTLLISGCSANTKWCKFSDFSESTSKSSYFKEQIGGYCHSISGSELEMSEENLCAEMFA